MGEELNKNKFEERAYKMLYEKYRDMFEKIHYGAQSKTAGEDDNSKKEYLGFIGNMNKYSYCGIIGKEDIAIVNALEHCLGINSSLRNAK
jgi:hypothetical protein